ncbi:hypothetical protein ABL840_06340 [Variovorax sp. NFACC27]|uniref:hypothetical protein n=1 Tax=unclassified Variovorax TaxID=663243 RepID=UPI000894DFB6|nr:hypothetical protein SAMN03159371_00397 [Variovorax sp. NFACC28]SEF61151.1 hypothetical protein SAMN03159365_00421 [Variovorax sp. NFACC29]SFB72660.1 hypothetical protein SAMN03159379_00420 [Variovorax sp. NFACC26]SFG56595.1 hypothetical protein SAMN03159447_03885 [Variovorax sp. NFACC27]
MDTIFLEDTRVNCLSGLGHLDVKDYLSLVNDVYKENGGIAGQRAPLKTKTGINIRKRMIDDIKRGAILPPIVIGAVVPAAIFDQALACASNEDFSNLIKSIDRSALSIIDGMQRTTALDAAVGEAESGKFNKTIRIDFWLAKSIDSLVYRMLVLNTGQVPWDIKRQLETIYKQILVVIGEAIPNIDVFNIDEKERRSGAGQYRATRIVELFLAFTSRKPHIEIKEKVAEDFARMEATEATSNEQALPAFIETMKLLAALDEGFASTATPHEYIDESTRFKEGRDIFTSAPASIAFSAAAAQYLLGKPGYPFEFSELTEKLEALRKSVLTITSKIAEASSKADFIDYLTLNQKISARSGRIGEYEREFFFRAFEHMFAHAEDLQTLTPCWSAYK